MFYEFLFPLHEQLSFLNIFRYITFRTIYGGLTAFLICFFLGPWVIRKLAVMQIGQVIQTDGPQTHLGKQGTPTMGGILILFSVFIATIFWGNLTNHYIFILLLTLLLFGAIGFVDDFLMQIKKRNMGFTARGKFIIQMACGLLISLLIFLSPDFTTTLTLPFFKNFSPDLGIWYIPFACLVIVGASNAVNLTDGLDGLAIGPVIVASVTYMFLHTWPAITRLPNTCMSAISHPPERSRSSVASWQVPVWDFYGSTPTRPRFLWGIPGHCPWAPSWAPLPWW